MKLCPRCQTQNEDTNYLCARCGASMARIGSIDSTAIMEQEFRRAERRDRRVRTAARCACAVLGVATLALIIAALVLGRLQGEQLLLIIVMTIIGFLTAMFPDELFKLQHLFTISNVDEVETTPFYKITSVIGGILMMLLGPILLLVQVFGASS